MENWSDYTADYSALNNAVGNTSSFEELPDGAYTCSVKNLELKRSKKGKPMVAADFVVADGPYTKQHLFVNLVLLNGGDNDSFFVHRCNEFLRGFNVITDVSLSTVPQYAQTIEYIRGQIAQNNSHYTVQKSTNNRGYTNYEIVDGPYQFVVEA